MNANTPFNDRPKPGPDFDVPLDRRGTQSIKWDLKTASAGGHDVLPMWVADMDFAVPDAVLFALRERLDHPVFGYSTMSESHCSAFTSWQLRRNHWSVEPEWLVYAPGVMPAVRAAILSLTEPGDEVVVQPPVYYPFLESVRELDRTVVANPLVLSDSRYEMDLDHLRSVITPKTRLLLLCSPHNPVGRVWSKHELESLAAICLQNNVVILSDEIHGDLIRRGENFVPFASVAPEMAHLSLTCSAPTKTFNLAGLSSAFVIASDPSIRTKISTMFRHLGHDLPNVMSLAAAEAAYASGEAWLEALLDYLTATFEWFENEVSNRFPSIGLSRIEGTYLAWLDIRGMIADLGVNETRVQRTLLRETGLWLSAGTPFGSAGYLRMNLGCPRPTVEDGLDRLHRGLDLLR